MTRLIIIEGLDGVGKTELAGQLYIDNPAPLALLHAGAPTGGRSGHWEEEYCTPLADLAGTGYTVVCDRWHLGEFVWSTLFKRDCLFENFDEMRELEGDMSKMFDEVVCVYLTRDHEDIKKIRDINYSIPHAAELYEHAVGKSALNWETGTLVEFLKGGVQSDVLFPV